MRHKQIVLAGAILAFVTAAALAAPMLTPKEIETAKHIFTSRCVECHTNKRKPQIKPTHYTDEKWAEWYRKMKAKAKLTPDEDQLMSRYFDAVRKGGLTPQSSVAPPSRPIPPPTPVIVTPPPAPTTSKPFVGLILRDLDGNATERGISIVGVHDASPAATAGLDAGDVILSLDGKAVSKASDLQALFDSFAPNTELTLEIFRDGKPLTIKVTVGIKR